MWKCPKCETINKGEYCAVCGERHVIIAPPTPAPSPSVPPYAPPAPAVPSSAPAPKKSKIKIVLIIIAIIAVLVAGVIVGIKMYLSGEESKYNTMLEEAEAAFENNDYELCLDKIDDMKSNHYFNKKAQALLIEGKAYMELEDYYSAIDSFEKALEIEEVSEGYCNLAVCYAKTGQESEALNVLNSQLSGRIDINSYIKAEIYLSKNQYDDAIKYFYDAIDKTKDDSLKRKAYIEIARIYKQQRHEDKQNYYYLNKQIEVMEEAVRVLKAEDDLTLTEMMGEAYFTAKEYDLSLMKFNRLLQLGYDRAYIYRNMAIICQQIGELNQAEDILLDMKSKYPEDYQCYLQLAFVYVEMENQKPQEQRDYTKVVDNYELAQKYVTNQNQSDLAQLERIIDELKDKGWI